MNKTNLPSLWRASKHDIQFVIDSLILRAEILLALDEPTKEQLRVADRAVKLADKLDRGLYTQGGQ